MIIDPGLGGRRPTQWVRPVAVYDRTTGMPPAIPEVDEVSILGRDRTQCWVRPMAVYDRTTGMPTMAIPEADEVSSLDRD